jgi:hypothetical protein
MVIVLIFPSGILMHFSECRPALYRAALVFAFTFHGHGGCINDQRVWRTTQSPSLAITPELLDLGSPVTGQGQAGSKG